MNYKFLITVILFLLISSRMAAQIILDRDSANLLIEKELQTINQDSLKLQKLIEACENCYKQLTKEQLKYQPNDACLAYFGYGSQLLALAEKMNHQEGKIIGNFYKGVELELRNKEQEAEKYYLQWLALREKEAKITKTPTKVYWAYEHLSNFYSRTWQLGKEEKILKLWYTTALQQHKEPIKSAIVAKYLGYFYKNIRKYQQTVSYCNIAFTKKGLSFEDYNTMMKQIRINLLEDRQDKMAITIDNAVLDVLAKENMYLFEQYLNDCINHSNNIEYQASMFEKFYRYSKTICKIDFDSGVKFYTNNVYIIISSVAIQQKYIQQYLQLIDELAKNQEDKQQKYMDLFHTLQGRIRKKVEIELIWNELLPRLEKAKKDKLLLKEQLYSKIIIHIQTCLILPTEYNGERNLIEILTKIETLHSKPNQDEADKAFLAAVQKECNFARKVKGYYLWR